MKELKQIYYLLLDEFGPQDWWPGETNFEIIVGAILTQNVNWNNVETAISNLKDEGILSPEKIINTEDKLLYELIKPTGFYRQKTSRLKRISRLIIDEGVLKDLFNKENLRKKLLDIKGIGPETADSIILYAVNEPSFVVDAYTFRILTRYDNITGSYNEIKELFESTFNNDISKLQEIHALIVELGKNYCFKTNPKCDVCPLFNICKHANQR